VAEILDRTIDFLLDQTGVNSRQVHSLNLTNYFTVVQLDDRSVGACWSDYQLATQELAEIERSVRSVLFHDSLALNLTRSRAAFDGVARSIRAAVANALSAPILSTGEDSFFVGKPHFPKELFAEIENAVVVGFGGLLDYLIRNTKTRRIHVLDLEYPLRRESMETKVTRYRIVRPDLRLSISSGQAEDYLREADFVAITGSTLCNNTLERLLLAAHTCKTVILQGQSASIHPKVLFEWGIDLVVTTLKPPELVLAAASDRAGQALRRFLEDGLPWIYLRPKPLNCGDLTSSAKAV